MLGNRFNRNEIRIKNLEKIISELRIQLDNCQDKISEYEKGISVISRQLLWTKWKVIDSYVEKEELLDDLVKCTICGDAHKRKDYKVVESECIFNGGRLVRYVCPTCGVIFGPTKFTSQGENNIGEDYRVHYLGFNEGDSSYKEERAFYMLSPDKNKIYLNFGCGRWSGTLKKLRGLGYNVYGFEPYASNKNSDYIITDVEQLKRMRFDGIFTNDVLEHFLLPIDELKFMTELLSKDGKMAHCTSCYTYKYEFTRFHTHFFTGKSVSVMAERAGLEIIDYCDDLAENDFICYVFKIK